jgi:hypothetical protein
LKINGISRLQNQYSRVQFPPGAPKSQLPLNFAATE